MNNPLVSVIMPTANRAHLLPLAIENFLKQDYPNKELIIICNSSRDLPDNINELNRIDRLRHQLPYDKQRNIIWNVSKFPIGSKRNIACQDADGEIILHMDDDDWFAPNWITTSVTHLLTSGADMTGLEAAFYLKQPDKLFEYRYDRNLPPHIPYVSGNTMCYRKSYWEQNKFRDISQGEDWYFCTECPNVIPHPYIGGFVGIIHGGNISSGKHLHNKAYSPVDISHLHNIMGVDIKKYVTLQGKTS